MNPIGNRYTTSAMSTIWSKAVKYQTWRLLWVALASAQKECGVAGITEAGIEQMTMALPNSIDFDRADAIEEETKHDVVAHIQLFAEDCPKAASFIHLGATSSFITDNYELISIRDSLQQIDKRLNSLIEVLRNIIERHVETPCLGYTHGQPAQITTFGKRAAMWTSDVLDDLDSCQSTLLSLRCRGIKGATGTQATFAKLFDNNQYELVKKLNDYIAQMIGFDKSYPITGQTYSRKVDSKVIDVLSRIAQTCSKIAGDIRLLSAFGEVNEQFGKKQVGSSAMPYKKNPINCEKICGLSRHIFSIQSSTSNTAASQWLERSLDDSSIRRITLMECFILCDYLIKTTALVLDSLSINVDVMNERVRAMDVNLASEELIIAAWKTGVNRQEAHEEIRRLRHKFSRDGAFWFALQESSVFEGVEFPELGGSVGLAVEQTKDFLGNWV